MVATISFDAPKRSVNRVFIHCSASEDDTLIDGMLYRKIRQWHVKERGWSDIGYHYLIDKLGNIQPARPLNKIPAAQKGHNTGTIAIMVHGLENFHKLSMNSLHHLCNQIHFAYSGRISFHGHCEVSNKTCPVFDYKEVLKLDRWGRMN